VPAGIDNAATWWVIEGDPQAGFKRVVTRAKMASEYEALAPFYLDGHPCIFGIHGEKYGNIWRVEDDPSQGFTLEYYGRNK
jgi:hypothetical protein